METSNLNGGLKPGHELLNSAAGKVTLFTVEGFHAGIYNMDVANAAISEFMTQVMARTGEFIPEKGKMKLMRRVLRAGKRIAELSEEPQLYKEITDFLLSQAEGSVGVLGMFVDQVPKLALDACHCGMCRPPRILLKDAKQESRLSVMIMGPGGLSEMLDIEDLLGGAGSGIEGLLADIFRLRPKDRSTAN